MLYKFKTYFVRVLFFIITQRIWTLLNNSLVVIYMMVTNKFSIEINTVVFNCQPCVISGGSRIFPRRGRQLPRGVPTYDFAKISQKLHEIERIWTPKGGRGARPKFYYVDPPLVITNYVLARFH